MIKTCSVALKSTYLGFAIAAYTLMAAAANMGLKAPLSSWKKLWAKLTPGEVT